MGWVVRLAAIVGTITSIWVAPAAAQKVPETGGRVFGWAGGSFGDGGTTVMTGGGILQPDGALRPRQGGDRKRPAGNRIVIDRSGTFAVKRIV